jgi:6-phosphofructokinase
MRSEQMGKDYGVVLLPEGLIEFVPEFNRLIADINEVLAAGSSPFPHSPSPLPLLLSPLFLP